MLVMAVDDSLDSATVSFLLQMALKKEEEEKEEERAAKLEEEEGVLMRIRCNQLTLVQQLRVAEDHRSGAAQAWCAAAEAKRRW